MRYLAILDEATQKVRTNEESPHDSFTSYDSYTENVIPGPWNPSTPEQVAEHRRRVLEEEPRRWWWKPRYQLADLERAGMERADAVDQVRAEFAVDGEGR
jgi:hypothetical protein